MNPFKQTVHREAVSAPVPWCPNAFYLDERPAFTADPLFHAGLYYVQEASSMFLATVLRQWVTTPVLMLDLCAAPGGKSTLARSVLPEGSLLVSNDPVRTRAEVLSENMMKWGHEDTIVTNNYPRDLARTRLLFDIILTDLPCSGEGMFRKDPNTIAKWSEQNVQACAKLSRSIVEDIWPSLKPGGLIIFSTCTFNERENEENVEWIINELGAELLAIDIDDDWNIIQLKPCCYRFLPGFTRGEGLFMAALRKKAEGHTCSSSLDVRKTDLRGHGQDSYSTETDGGILRLIPQAWLHIYKQLKGLHLLHAGIELSRTSGKHQQPHECLALHSPRSASFLSQYPRVNVSREEALRYLHGDTITLPNGTPLKEVVISYQDAHLGFARNLGTRANNLYPKTWRIRSTHLQDEL